MTWPGVRFFGWRDGSTRVTSSGEFIPQVDGLRFLAVLMTLGHHVFAGYLEFTHRLGTQELPRDWALIWSRSPLVAWGVHLAFGVQVFFTISGFVLAIPYARGFLRGLPRPSWQGYLLRRLVRLEPSYVLNLLFLFLVIVIPWRQDSPLAYFRSFFAAFAPHLAASLVYLHGAVFADASWINGVAWTLEVEIQFYLLVPLLVEVYRLRPAAWRRTVLAAMTLAAALVAEYLVGPSGNQRLRLSLAFQAQYFLAGLLLADIYVDPPRIPALVHHCADVLAVASAALLIYILHSMPALAPAEAFLVGAFCLAALYGTWTSRVFRFPVFTVIGGMSYTIYLYHFFIVRTLLPLTVGWFPADHGLGWDVSVQFALVLPPVLAVSAILFWFTERPFMILSREVSRRFRPVPKSGEAKV